MEVEKYTHSNKHISKLKNPGARKALVEFGRWKKERLFFEGDEYFKAILDKIDGAKAKIFLEFYIFDLDPVGRTFLNALRQAVDRGVEVKIIIDGFGSALSIPSVKAECEKRNLDLRVYHPLPILNTLDPDKMWPLVLELNKRDHRKVVIIDEKTVFVGSFNISEVHSKKIKGPNAWQDAGVCVEGKDVKYFAQSFIRNWDKSGLHMLERVKSLARSGRMNPSGLVRLNSKRKWRKDLYEDLLFRIYNAENKILITNAYFLPRTKVIRALCHAAHRGVYVGLCIPAKSDVWVVKAATKLLYSRFIKFGTRLFEYQPTVLHAKTIIIDNWAMVGTHNLNHRSFVHDLESDVVISHLENIKKLELKWEENLTNSKEILYKDIDGTLWGRFVSSFAFRFRYWI